MIYYRSAHSESVTITSAHLLSSTGPRGWAQVDNPSKGSIVDLVDLVDLVEKGFKIDLWSTTSHYNLFCFQDFNYQGIV